MLCKKNVFLPTTWNKIKNYQENQKNEINIQYEKCENSFKNPCCLNCIKKFINKLNHPIWKMKNKIECPYNCCNGLFIREKQEKIYGDIYRKNNELPENNLWNILKSYSSFNYICNNCNLNTNNIEHAYLHSLACYNSKNKIIIK